MAMNSQLAPQVTPAVPVASFFSQMQLRRLHRKGRAPRHAGTESHNGAFLFIDLVSFTKLGEQLRERGLKGAEVMSDILNAYFQPILSTILSLIHI